MTGETNGSPKGALASLCVQFDAFSRGCPLVHVFLVEMCEHLRVLGVLHYTHTHTLAHNSTCTWADLFDDSLQGMMSTCILESFLVNM